MSSIASIEADLEARAGAGALSREPGGRLIVSPDSVASASAVLSFCSAEGIRVALAGACTWLPNHDQEHIVLSTRRMNQITEHEPADLVIGVQAGVTMAALQQKLRTTGQYIPLDPPAAAEATIGAVVARGDAGPLRAAFGTPRDLALGLEIVTGDGRIVHFGGRVVKNVAGYDGVRLTVGSAGQTGLITAVFLRVRGVPRADQTFVVPCPDAAAAAATALSVRDRLNCSALELLSPSLMQEITKKQYWGLLIRFSGNEAGVAEAAARLTGIAPATEPVRDGAAAWRTLCEIETSGSNHARDTAPPADLAQTLAGAPDGHHVAAHAADGIVRTWTTIGHPISKPRFPDNWCQSPFVGTQAIADRIRGSFDPARILLPGRVE